MTGGKVNYIVFTCLLMVNSAFAQVELNTKTEKKAKEDLAQKLIRLSKDLDVIEGTYPESRDAAANNTNRNDKNPLGSNTTLHTEVTEECVKWAGYKNCEEWMPAYVSKHGADGDKSPLEGLVYDLWQGTKQTQQNAPESGGQGQYAFWRINSDQASYLKYDGTLDKKAITDWKILPQARRKIEKLGEDTAKRAMNRTFTRAEEKSNPDVMPNREALQDMAGKWTKVFRNRLISNIGDIRASKPGVEVIQAEDIPLCNDYKEAVRRNPDQYGVEEKTKPQNYLDPVTRGVDIDERMRRCRKMKAITAYAANVEIQGDDAKIANKEEAYYDEAMSRANLEMIDEVGKSITEVKDLPSRIKVNPNEDKVTVGDYKVGGRELRNKRVTNAQQLVSYNSSLDDAAVGYQEVASRTNFIQDRSDEVTKWKIKRRSINAVKLNSLTPEMRNEIKDTDHPRGQGKGKDPGDNLETTPGDLVVTRTGQ